MKIIKHLSILAMAGLWFFPAMAKPLADHSSTDTLARQKRRVLVAYYSRTGTTRTVARALAERLGADLEEITDTKNRSGLWGWLSAGRDASKKSKTVIGPLTKNPADYDLVILGTPIWAWNMTPAIRTYILQNREAFKKVAFFCTMGGSGDVKAFAGMADLCGQKPLATLSLRTQEVRINQYYTGVGRFVDELQRRLNEPKDK